eukprot:m.55745 g.55745  ORF g.55745 m.55745 type:complete len:512 (-) comp7768_c0_seq1:174-1709(-)
MSDVDVSYLGNVSGPIPELSRNDSPSKPKRKLFRLEKGAIVEEHSGRELSVKSDAINKTNATEKDGMKRVALNVDLSAKDSSGKFVRKPSLRRFSVEHVDPEESKKEYERRHSEILEQQRIVEEEDRNKREQELAKREEQARLKAEEEERNTVKEINQQEGAIENKDEGISNSVTSTQPSSTVTTTSSQPPQQEVNEDGHETVESSSSPDNLSLSTFSTDTPTEVTIEGFLDFRVKGSLFKKHKWRKLYAHLHGTRFLLSKQKGDKPVEVISISSRTAGEIIVGKPNQLKIVSDRSSFFFREVEATPSLQEWCDAVNNCRLSAKGKKRSTQKIFIHRELSESFGITIAGGIDSPRKDVQGVYVVDVKKGSVAENKLFKSDELLEVNGNSLSSLTHDEVNKVLGETIGDVELVVSRKKKLSSNSLDLPPIAENDIPPPIQEDSKEEEKREEKKEERKDEEIKVEEKKEAEDNADDKRKEMRRRLSEKRLEQKRKQSQDLEAALKIIDELDEE